MNRSKCCLNVANNRTGVLGLMVIFIGLCLSACEQSTGMVHPVEDADAVVMKFYEYISEARLKGGTSPLREAYKLINSKGSHISQAKFMEIASKYPPGFKADVTNSKVKGVQAFVTISYKLPSSFGSSAYTVQTVVPLTLDKTTNTWKIDFTGESDGQGKYVSKKGS